MADANFPPINTSTSLWRIPFGFEDIKSSKQLGQLVRKTRKTQGLSQEDLAGLSGTGRRFISDLENGKATAPIGMVLHVLNTLGIVLLVNQWG